MTAYYNEHDQFCCDLLAELMKDGLIAPGVIDNRSIVDVQAADLKGFRQAHFFAGCGIWSLALRHAGWADDRAIWTASIPCQPWSSAGLQAGADDERHLWPAFFDLVKSCRPNLMVGEQVASSIVVGSSDVQRMRGGKAARIIPKAQSWRVSEHVSNLRERVGENHQTLVQELENRLSAETALRKAWIQLSGGRQEKGKGQGAPILTGLARNTAENRLGLVRSDQYSLFTDDRESGVECSIAGSDQSGDGVHAGQCASGDLRPEHDGRNLGNGSDADDSGNDFEQEDGLDEELVGEDSGESDGTDGPAWLDIIFDDLEIADYDCGAIVFPACGVGAPHIRSRLYWVADTESGGFAGERSQAVEGGLRHPDGSDAIPLRLVDSERSRLEGHSRDGDNGDEPGRVRALATGPTASPSSSGRLADANSSGSTTQPGNDGEMRGIPNEECGPKDSADLSGGGGGFERVGDTERERSQGFDIPGIGEGMGTERPQSAGASANGGTSLRMADPERERHGGIGADIAETSQGGGRGDAPGHVANSEIGRPGPTNGLWRDADWLGCTDGKWRPVESSPLALADDGTVCDILAGGGREGGALTFPLAKAGTYRNRVEELRVAGNAINVAQAAGFIRAIMNELPE